MADPVPLGDLVHEVIGELLAAHPDQEDACPR